MGINRNGRRSWSTALWACCLPGLPPFLHTFGKPVVIMAISHLQLLQVDLSPVGVAADDRNIRAVQGFWWSLYNSISPPPFFFFF